MRAILERYESRLGPPVDTRVIGLGVATVDADRAAAELPDLVFRPAPDDALLGARVLAATLPSGRTLRLLEPTREGRLTGFLARHGEALAVLFVSDATGGEARLIAGAAGEPVVVLVDSPAAPAGTMPP